MKPFIFIFVLFCATAIFCVKQYKTISEQEKTITALKKDQERERQDAERIKNESEKIKNMAKKDKNSFNWNYDYSNTDLIKWMQNKCLSCKG
uniref:Cell division protein ftsl n=1 Tax=Dulem virus 29 TaxID=3145747 RepID=A0AAU8AWK4_9CAUD